MIKSSDKAHIGKIAVERITGPVAKERTDRRIQARIRALHMQAPGISLFILLSLLSLQCVFIFDFEWMLHVVFL